MPKKRAQARPRPEGKRVWASLEMEPFEVIEEAVLEAPGAKRLTPRLGHGGYRPTSSSRASASRPAPSAMAAAMRSAE